MFGSSFFVKSSKRSIFVEDESGAVTIEFVLWLPVFLIIMMIITDVTLIFAADSRMWSLSRDAVRQISVRQLSASDAVEYVTNRAAGMGSNLEVSAYDTGPDVWVSVSAPINDVSLFGIMDFVTGDRLTARVTQRLEPI